MAKNFVATVLGTAFVIALFAAVTPVVFAHGDEHATDDHSAETITAANAQAHINLAIEAKAEADAYVASLEDTDESRGAGSVPHLSHLARDLAGAQAAYDDGDYVRAADLGQKVADHAQEIMSGEILATDIMDTHSSHGAMDTSETSIEVEVLRTRVIELMNVLIGLLTERLASMR